MNANFPFELGDIGVIQAFIEDEPLFSRYSDIFQKYDYSGNGYSWEGHIIQILEQLDPELLSHIQFDPEAGCFFANADSNEARTKFVTILSPIFSDNDELEKWIIKADRTRIDD